VVDASPRLASDPGRAANVGRRIRAGKWLHTLPGPTDEVEATITGFAPEDAPKFGRGEIVTATVAGVHAEADVEVDRLFGCRVGDKIPAKRRGFTVVLQPRPCKH